MIASRARTRIGKTGIIAAAIATLVAVSMAPAARAAQGKPGKLVVTSLSIAGGAGPSASPICYPASAVYTGKATCFGSAYIGGSHLYGGFYATDGDGTHPRLLLSFDALNGLFPSQSPVLGPDKMTLYGTTTQGGSAGSGAIVSYNIKTKTATTLASFTGPGGSTPQGGPIIVGDALYGIAGQGGAYGYGVVYSMPLAGGPIKVLHSFAGGKDDIATGFGGLLYNPADGQLYGMCFTAGANGLGGIFSIDPSGSGYKLRASLTPQTGGAPQMGGLVLAPNGLMYANAWVAGANKLGTLFSFNPTTNAVTTVLNYTSRTGTQPYNMPAVSPSGKWLYVLGWEGGKYDFGTILAVATDGSRSKVLLNLRKSQTGGETFANPNLSSDGKRIVAAMTSGGKNGIGTLVSLRIPADYR